MSFLMAKIDLDTLQLILQRNSINAMVTAQIISDIQEQLRLEKIENEENREPPVKKKYVFLACDPEGILEGNELTGYVIQIPEDESEFSVTEKISAAAYEYNRTKKGQKNPAESISDACEIIPAKIFKDQKVWVRNKEAAFLLPTNNEIAGIKNRHKEY